MVEAWVVAAMAAAATAVAATAVAATVVYDAVGPWAACSQRDLTYWHCLDDELWRPLHEDDGI